MIKYFGYGSNMDLTALRAKGVTPRKSVQATLIGWRLRFSVEHFFRHEGGVGNIEKTGNAQDKVLGILHWCNDDDLARLDKLEARGIGYDRITLPFATHDGDETGYAYVGLPAYVNQSLLPTQRYLNILVRGATNAGLESGYITFLRDHPIQERVLRSEFTPPVASEWISYRDISKQQTILAGHVFDMRDARQAHVVAKDWFGAKDVTVFHLKRMDSSDGTETLDDVVRNQLRSNQREYLNTYLHAFNEEYNYVGPFDYSSLPPEMQLS